nr:hypothetical protein Iba_chr08dCG10920 [Ipomoea batatas]
MSEIATENSEGLRRLRKSRRQSRSKFSERYTLVQSLFALFIHSVSSSSVLQFPLSWPVVIVGSLNVPDWRLGRHFKFLRGFVGGVGEQPQVEVQGQAWTQGMNLRNDGHGNPRSLWRRTLFGMPRTMSCLRRMLDFQVFATSVVDYDI